MTVLNVVFNVGDHQPCFVCGQILDINKAHLYELDDYEGELFACVDPCHSNRDLVRAGLHVLSQRTEALKAFAQSLDMPRQLYDPDYLPLDEVDPYDPDAEREAIIHARAEAQTAALRPGIERAKVIHTTGGSFDPVTGSSLVGPIVRVDDFLATIPPRPRWKHLWTRSTDGFAEEFAVSCAASCGVPVEAVEKFVFEPAGGSAMPVDRCLPCGHGGFVAVKVSRQ